MVNKDARNCAQKVVSKALKGKDKMPESMSEDKKEEMDKFEEGAIKMHKGRVLPPLQLEED